MNQDKGKKMVVIDTGQVVETTGLMLPANLYGWLIQVKYKNGVKGWCYEKELDDYIS